MVVTTEITIADPSAADAHAMPLMLSDQPIARSSENRPGPVAASAMTTDRPYRQALDPEEAMRRLEEAAGSQFDPRVVEVCLLVLEHAPVPD